MKMKNTEQDLVTFLNSLTNQLINKLKDVDLVLVTAESCTGGWISQTITEIPGSSNCFDRGYVCYSNESKQEMLDVSGEVIQRCGAVSEEVARAMAEGALKKSQANISVAVTGIAGPSGGTIEKPIGTCWFAWSGNFFATVAKHQCFTGNRTEIRYQAVCYALEQLQLLISSKLF